jgi:hypothetical protein
MRARQIAAALACAALIASALPAQTPPSAQTQSPPLQILVYTPQGQPMALTPYPAPPAVQRNALRMLIEDTPNRVVVLRHAPQPAIQLQGGGALEIESIGVFEPGFEQQRLFGIRVTLNREELPENERTFYLEPRDVDPIVRAIEMLEQVAASAAENATDAEFHLPEGIGLGFRTVGGRIERTVRASRGKLVRFVLPADGLTRLRAALEAARQGIFGG